jgi:hypothetical protein
LDALAAGLIETHYDPAYRRSAGAAKGTVRGQAALPRLDAESFEQAASEVARLVARV